MFLSFHKNHRYFTLYAAFVGGIDNKNVDYFDHFDDVLTTNSICATRYETKILI